MEFRKAVQSDFSNVILVYRSAIAYMTNMGINQWDDVYPSTSLIKEDIDSGGLYIGLSGRAIASVFTLSPTHEKDYEVGHWQYGNLRYSVVHRLCVDPSCQHNGVGTQTMNYVEAKFRNEHIEAVRLDAFSQNPAALRLYEKLCYKKVGEVTFRKGLFYLFEKSLV